MLYPIGDLVLRTRVVPFFNFLERSQWWSEDELREWQKKKLQDLLRHAYANVPYYRRMFNKQGISPENVRDPDDLKILPVLTKDMIRADFKDFMSNDIGKRRAVLNSTAGSTGTPFKYYSDMDAFSMSWAATFRAWTWAGYRLGDKRVTFGGSSLVPNAGASLVQGIRDRLERNRRLSSFGISDRVLSEYVELIHGYRAPFLRGYASSIYELALFVKRQGISYIRPKAVFTTAEMLLPRYREVIEEQFGCRVFDNWGCNDGGGNACECEKHSGFHSAAERSIIEFVNSESSGDGSGEIVLTDLHNYSMPFIRYLNGDVGTPSSDKCPCGRSLPLLKSINGRANTFVTTPEGKRFHGAYFSHIFYELSSFTQFQVIQKSSDHWIIRVVPIPAVDSLTQQKDIEKLKKTIAQSSQRVNVEVQVVDAVPTSKAGKWRYIVNECANC
jgi:phenylacetate-CoA ligase